MIRRWGILLIGLLTIVGPTAQASPVVKVGTDGQIHSSIRTAISFTYSPTGWHTGTANEHDPMAAVSLVKLYIADYVFAHGTELEKTLATEMLQTSNDFYADYFSTKYPQAIRTTLRLYDLDDSIDTGYWGTMMTSAYDVASYLEQAKRKDSPVIEAMRGVKPVAADGYKQDYGTSVLPQVVGSKFGWANVRNSYNASASFGADFSVVALTIGSAADNTADVEEAFVEGETFNATRSVDGSPPLPVLDGATATIPLRPPTAMDRLRTRLLPNAWKASQLQSRRIPRRVKELTPSVVIPMSQPAESTTSVPTTAQPAPRRG